MDRHTIFVIVATAAVTTTVTVSVGWMLNLFKSAITTGLAGKVKTEKGKNVLKMLGCLLMIGMLIWDLYYHLTGQGPPTRRDVLMIVIDVFSVLFWLIGVMWFYAKIRRFQ